MNQPFFVEDGAGGFVATESARGPWSNDHQHAGPPCALLARGMKALVPAGHTLARFTCDMLRPIPLGGVRLDVAVEKAGKKTSLVRGRLVSGPVDGPTICLEARAVFVRELVDGAPRVVHASAPLSPAAAEPFAFNFFRAPIGYHTSVEMRRVAGEWGSGAMVAWMRQAVPLIGDALPTPAERVLVVADAGSGVSAALDFQHFTFANADLDVHLVRQPRGEWLLLDAETTIDPTGRGLTRTALFDEDGPVGQALQTLVVEPVPA